MNIETLVDYISFFEEKIIESGFKRDLQDFVQSLPNNQNNIVALREVAQKVYNSLKEIYESDLPDKLNVLLPNESIQPFTKHNYLEEIENLINDKEIQLPQFYQKLSQILTNLNNQIQQNINELQKLKDIFQPYIKQDIKELTEENAAILAIIFRHRDTITSLKNFSKTINLWNRNLLLYHQILSSKTPDDIRLLEVQNGSIDFIINLDLQVAINITELFKIGLKAYLAYLTYKTMVAKIVESYFGNEKLIESEKEREKELLNNIKLAILKKIREQHKEAKEKDKNIIDHIDVIAKQVTKLITSHIINGNEIKLLALPDFKTEDEADKDKFDSIINNQKELEKLKTEVKEKVRQLPRKELLALEDKYSSPEEDENDE